MSDLLTTEEKLLFRVEQLEKDLQRLQFEKDNLEARTNTNFDSVNNTLHPITELFEQGHRVVHQIERFFEILKKDVVYYYRH